MGKEMSLLKRDMVRIHEGRSAKEVKKKKLLVKVFTEGKN